MKVLPTQGPTSWKRHRRSSTDPARGSSNGGSILGWYVWQDLPRCSWNLSPLSRTEQTGQGSPPDECQDLGMAATKNGSHFLTLEARVGDDRPYSDAIPGIHTNSVGGFGVELFSNISNAECAQVFAKSVRLAR